MGKSDHLAMLEFPGFKVLYLQSVLIMLPFFISLNERRRTTRSGAPKVSLSGFAGGECLPLPGSVRRRTPSLLTLEGRPTSPATSLIGPRRSPKTQETSACYALELVNAFME